MNKFTRTGNLIAEMVCSGGDYTAYRVTDRANMETREIRLYRDGTFTRGAGGAEMQQKDQEAVQAHIDAEKADFALWLAANPDMAKYA